MELLVAQRVTRLLDGRELLAGVSLRLADGQRVGLVGPNGSGKSTLLRLLAGEAEPDSGSVRRAPGVRVGFLPQASGPLPSGGTVLQHASRALAHVRELERRMQLATGPDEHATLEREFERAGGYGAEAMLRRELASVGFPEADLQRDVATLSAGERRRLDLATTLAASPEVLLLDEPTNHLDVSARARLSERLATWKGALVVVSHDRALLDGATERTAFLEQRGPAGEPARLVVESGPYGVARARRDRSLRAEEKRDRERAKEAERLEAMARELATFGRKATARKRAAERGVKRLRLATAARAAPPPATPRLARPFGRRSPNRPDAATLLEATALTRTPVLAGARVRVARGQRIALLGPNGSGKSTLLRLLSGDLPSEDPAAELRFAPGLRLRLVGQEDRGLSDSASVWEQVEERVGAAAGGALLAGAGVPPARWDSRPGELSGGERARAGLALSLVEDADLWLVDEPTNDLDLAAVEALESQLESKLEESGAALVLATHDRRLAERLTGEVWALEGGEVIRYRGVREYLAGERAPDRTGPDGAHTAQVEPARSAGADPAPEPTEDLDDLEEQRLELLRLRDEEPSLTERERSRVRALLTAVEERLMAAYAARLPAPAPTFRLVEDGLVLFAEWLTLARAATNAGATRPPRLAILAPQEYPPSVQGPRPLAQIAADALDVLAPAPDSEVAEPVLPDPDVVLAECAAAWLEVRLEGGIGHLRFVYRRAACPLPHVLVALANAGARLAFTRLGSRAVQLHHAGELTGSLLRSAGEGWWSLGLGQFLAAEGWRA